MTALETIFGRRRAGILAHITSLPDGGTDGDSRPAVYPFVDFLARAGFTVWQTLPIGPVDISGSPYQATSVFAGNVALLPPEDGLASPDSYGQFFDAESYWLDDYALYSVLKEQLGGAPWYQWPATLRDREPVAMAAAREQHAGRIEDIRHDQFGFFSAWKRLRSYAHSTGVYLFGDVAMFASHDSADVWAHREYFHLSEAGHVARSAGAPPDAYAVEGQNWGCPQYRWDAIARDGFRWWTERLRTQALLFDILRLDHFRGFEASWYIPEGRSAKDGRWEPVPGEALFSTARSVLGPLALVAEDLGHITPEVHALRSRLNLPGMHVLQFAFDGDGANPHLPHNHAARGIVYTGTHDNDTTLGWWRGLDDVTRQRVRTYLDFPDDPMPWPLVHAALASVCSLAMLPLQDCLGLGSESRMNTPGRIEGNWSWRCPSGVLDQTLERRLFELVQLYGRVD